MTDQMKAQGLSIRVLRNRLFAAAIMACLVVASVTAVVLSIAYYSRSKSTENLRLAHESELVARSIEEHLRKTKAVATQIASRTRARILLEKLNAGTIGPKEYRGESEAILVDALGSEAEVHGVIRLDPYGEVVARAGHDIPRTAWPVGYGQANQTLIGKPHIDQRHRDFDVYFVVSAPIRSSNQGRIGTDIVVFSLHLLFDLVRSELRHKGQAVEVAFLSAGWAVEIRSDGIEQARSGIMKWIDENRAGNGTVIEADADRIVALSPISEADWFVLVQVGAGELYQYLLGDVLRVAVVALVMGMILIAGSAMILRPFGTGIFLRAERLEEEVRHRTAEVRESERRLRDFSDAASDWFWETDTEHRFITLTDAFGRKTGLSEPTSAIGHTRWDLAGVDREDTGWRAHRDAIESRRPFAGFEYRYMRKDGDERIFRIDGKPVFDDNGKFVGYRGTGRDVTELAKANSDRERSERQFLESIATLPIAIALFDPDDRLLLWNRLYATLVAKDVPLVVGMGIEDVLRHAVSLGRVPEAIGHEDEWIRRRMDYHRAPAGTLTATLENVVVDIQEHRTRDGGTILVVQDMTRAKESEKEILRQRDLLETIIETIPLAVFWKDRGGVYQGCNSHFLSQRGLSDKKQVVGKTIRDFALRESEMRKVVAEDEAVMRGEITPVGDEQTRLMLDGSVRVHLSSKMPIRNSSGAVDGLVGAFLDVSEMTRTRQALADEKALLETLFETIPTPVFYRDTNGVYLNCNAAFCEFVGSPRGSIIGKTEAEFANKEAAMKCAESDAQLLNEGGTQVYERKVNFRDGSEHDVVYSKAAVRSSGNIVQGVVGVMLDVTEQKRVEQQLRKSQRLQSLGNMAAGMAHEINNLLLPITSLTRMTVKRMPEDAPERLRLEKVVDAADRAAKIIACVMEFGRQDAGEVSHVDPWSIVDSTIETVRPTLPPNISLKRRLSRKVGSVLVDAEAIGSAVNNLIANAVDSMAHISGMLEVHLERVDVDMELAASVSGLQTGPHARIVVADTGCGMDVETVSRAIDPFFTTKEVGQGTGLGLSIAHGIVERHGGAMRISSTIGNGTNVEIYLPLGDAFEPAIAAQGASDASEIDIIADMEKKYGTRVGN